MLSTETCGLISVTRVNEWRTTDVSRVLSFAKMLVVW